MNGILSAEQTGLNRLPVKPKHGRFFNDCVFVSFSITCSRNVTHPLQHALIEFPRR